MRRTLTSTLAAATLALGVSFGAAQAAPAAGGLETLKPPSTESANHVQKAWFWWGHRDRRHWRYRHYRRHHHWYGHHWWWWGHRHWRHW